MQRFVRRFLKGECGAITADWVVITAAIAIFASATILSIRTYVVAFGPAISEEIDKQMN